MELWGRARGTQRYRLVRRRVYRGNRRRFGRWRWDGVLSLIASAISPLPLRLAGWQRAVELRWIRLSRPNASSQQASGYRPTGRGRGWCSG